MRAVTNFILKKQLFYKPFQLIWACLISTLDRGAACNIVKKPIELFRNQLAPVCQQVTRQLLQPRDETSSCAASSGSAHEHCARPEILGFKPCLAQ